MGDYTGILINGCYSLCVRGYEGESSDRSEVALGCVCVVHYSYDKVLEQIYTR